MHLQVYTTMPVISFSTLIFNPVFLRQTIPPCQRRSGQFLPPFHCLLSLLALARGCLTARRTVRSPKVLLHHHRSDRLIIIGRLSGDRRGDLLKTRSKNRMTQWLIDKIAEGDLGGVDVTVGPKSVSPRIELGESECRGRRHTGMRVCQSDPFVHRLLSSTAT